MIARIKHRYVPFSNQASAVEIALGVAARSIKKARLSEMRGNVRADPPRPECGEI